MTEVSAGAHEFSAEDYLRQHGYLSELELPELKDADKEAIRAQILKAAVFEFQRSVLLLPTGELDDATVNMMRSPQCGTPRQDPLAFVSSGRMWPQSIIRYAVAGYSGDLPQADQDNILRAAYNAWSAVVPLTFQQVAANQQHEIDIVFTTLTNGDTGLDGPGGVQAYARFPGSNPIDGDIHFDDDENWAPGMNTAGCDLLRVALHEIGHALGLDHNTTDNTTLMWPYCNNPGYPGAPMPDDRAGMRNLYRDHIWIASMYRDLLGRRHADNDLDGWVRQLMGGSPPPSHDDLARGFCYSQEYLELLVTELYRIILGRAPDPAGLAFWAHQLASGTSYQTVLVGILDSNEFKAAYPPPNQYVEALYRVLLGRAPDLMGLYDWVASMDVVPPSVVAFAFLGSEEYANRLARQQYQQFLRRQPTAAEVQPWVDAIQKGVKLQEVTVGFLASDEYRNLAETIW
jgi:predicted Zn-dependent protease